MKLGLYVVCFSLVLLHSGKLALSECDNKSDCDNDDGDETDSGNQDKKTTQPQPKGIFGKIFSKFVKLNKYFAKSLKILSKYSKNRWTGKSSLDAIIAALTEELKSVAPKSAGVNPIEVHQPVKAYLCMMKGSFSDLRTIKFVKARTESKDDMILLHLTYEFENVYCTFDSFYINIVHTMEVRGKIVITFNENQVTLVVGIPKMSKLLQRIASKNCVLRIMDYQVSLLKPVECRILESDSVVQLSVAERAINNYLKDNEETFRLKFETTVMVQVHRALPRTGGWICKDDKIGDEVTKRGGRLQQYVPSDRMRAECMNEKKQTGWLPANLGFPPNLGFPTKKS